MAKAQPIAYLKIQGIPGGAIKKGFEEQISVHGYQHGIIRALGPMHESGYVPDRIDSLGGRMGNPREAHRPFTVFKVMDRATPLLIQALDKNSALKDPVDLSIIQSVLPGGSGPTDLIAMKISMYGAMVQAVEYSETGGEGTLERVSFAYNLIEFTFEGLDEAGKKSGSISVKVDLERK